MLQKYSTGAQSWHSAQLALVDRQAKLHDLDIQPPPWKTFASSFGVRYNAAVQGVRRRNAERNANSTYAGPHQLQAHVGDLCSTICGGLD